MSKLVNSEHWVWVIVQDPGGNEEFLGQKDTEKGVSFIPAFLEKEEAEKGLAKFSKQEGRKYEVQAIMFEDLCHRITGSGFSLFLLDGTGRVLERLDPEHSGGQ